MNYQHSYHAGNFADVIKHSVLTLVLESFVQKNTPFCFIDTHAGAGCYDITSEHSEKTQEAAEGILKLLADEANIPELLKSYLEGIKKAQLDQTKNNKSKVSQYPGSPWVADRFCRGQDRMILNELHPEAARLLKRQFNSRDTAFVHERDAYEFLLGVLPPKEKRGIILIDPPFEKKDEEHLIAHAMEKALPRFTQGVYLIWFPLTGKHPVWTATPKLQTVLKSAKTLRVNIRLNSLRSSEEEGLIGTSLLVINPPYLLKEKLEKIMPYFIKLFGRDPRAGWDINISE